MVVPIPNMTIPVQPPAGLGLNSLGFPGQSLCSDGTINTTYDDGFTTAAAAAEDITPVVLMVQPGEDIIQKISLLMTQFTGTVTVLTATGDISSVVLGHPTCTGVSVRIEGSFHIITLSGSISSTETGILVSDNEHFRVVLSKPDGQTFGGAITGPLIADTPIQVVLGNLSENNGRELQSSSTAAARDSI